MINLKAQPTWQWSSKNTTARPLSARPSNAGASAIKQALMPRSLDLNLEFALKYRR